MKVDEIRKQLSRYGKEQVERFDEWLELFGYLENNLNKV